VTSENTYRKKSKLPLILIILVLVIALVLTPLVIGLVKYNAGDYASAAGMLKLYPFTQEQYRDSVRQVGDAAFSEGAYLRAIEWYEMLGDDSIVPMAESYCALAMEQLENGKSTALVLETLASIPETSETITLRDRALADGAAHCFRQNETEDALTLLSHVESTFDAHDQSLLDAAEATFGQDDLETAVMLLTHVKTADVTPVRQKINTACIQDACALLLQVDESSQHIDGEPKCFVLLQSAQECLKFCADSPLAAGIQTALQDLLNQEPEAFEDTFLQTFREAGQDPAAPEAAEALWHCFCNLISNDNYQFLYNNQPYKIISSILNMGKLTAELSGSAAANSGSILDAMAELARDGEVRRWEQGLCMYEYSLDLTLERLGKAAGDQPKVLFIRNYLPIGVAPQEYCMDFGIDLNMMALLPLEYWPASMEEVTHVVSLHYFHKEVGEYFDPNSIYSSLGFGGTPAIQDTGCVRIYDTTTGKILLETQKLTGPMPPDSASSDQFQGGYYSAGDIDLSAQLKEALQKIFPNLK